MVTPTDAGTPAKAEIVPDVPFGPHAEECSLDDVVLREVRRFVSHELDPAKIEAGHVIPEGVRRAAASAGLFALTLPEVHGGLGLGLGQAGLVVEEIARVDRSVAIMIGLHAGLGTRAIVVGARPEIQREWLPRMAAGECIGSFAATEAGAGSDLTAIRTSGEAWNSGLRISGEKSYVTNGGFASLFTTLVRTAGTGGAKAHSLVLVPRSSPGLGIGPEEDKLGIRASSTVTVTFDNVVADASQILGEPGKGMTLAHEVLAWGRTVMASGCIGTARAALDAAVAQVTTRRQFGRPIGEFGATRRHIAWMAARLYAMEALVRSTASASAAGAPIEVLSTAAKVFASEGAFEICDRSLQLHGALGFMEPVGVARMLRDCRITRIFEGANDVLLVHLGAARIATRQAASSESGSSSPLGELRHECDALTARIDAEVNAIRKRWGVSVIRKQGILQIVARAEIARLAAIASLERVRHSASPGADMDLAAHGIETLCLEARQLLDTLSTESTHTQRSVLISDRLYGVADTPTHSGGPAS